MIIKTKQVLCEQKKNILEYKNDCYCSKYFVRKQKQKKKQRQQKTKKIKRDTFISKLRNSILCFITISNNSFLIGWNWI